VLKQLEFTGFKISAKVLCEKISVKKLSCFPRVFKSDSSGALPPCPSKILPSVPQLPSGLGKFSRVGIRAKSVAREAQGVRRHGPLCKWQEQQQCKWGKFPKPSGNVPRTPAGSLTSGHFVRHVSVDPGMLPHPPLPAPKLSAYKEFSHWSSAMSAYLISGGFWPYVKELGYGAVPVDPGMTGSDSL